MKISSRCALCDTSSRRYITRFLGGGDSSTLPTSVEDEALNLRVPHHIIPSEENCIQHPPARVGGVGLVP